MAKISITRTHTLGRAGAREVVNQVAADLGAKHQVQSHWEGDTLVIKRSGLDGTLAVTDTEVQIHVSLGLMLSAIKGLLEKEIHAQLDAKLA